MDSHQASRKAAEKEKIRDMLRDAVRILCQNTVSHRTKLSIEALFGITIDDGEDSIIFSIHESVGAAEDEAYETEEQYKDTKDDASYSDYGLHETTVNKSQFNDSVNYGQQYKPAVPYQAVVKKETSVISYNVEQYDPFPHNAMTSSQTTNQYFAADGSYSGYDNADYGHQSAYGVDGQNVVASGPRRGRGRGRGPGLKRAPQQNVTSARSLPTVKEEYGSEVDTTAGGKRQSMDAGEVAHVTIYTCQRCGKQMSRLDSFRRHKKSHLGIVYRCDGCGKVVSRSDYLTAHRRTCPAALQQAALD